MTLDVELLGAANVWVIAPGEGAEFWEKSVELGIVAIGYQELKSLGRLVTQAEVKRLLQEEGFKNPIHHRKAIWQFVKEMKIGDIVLAKQGTRKLRGWGTVTGDYNYVGERAKYPHGRTVDWIPFDSPLSLSTVSRQLPRKTLTLYTQDKLKERLEEIFELINWATIKSSTGTV